MPARSSASTLASSNSARATVVLEDANEDILWAVGAVGYDPEAPMSSGSVGVDEARLARIIEHLETSSTAPKKPRALFFSPTEHCS